MPVWTALHTAINVEFIIFFTYAGENISLTIELGVFFSEIVNNLSRIILYFEMDLQQMITINNIIVANSAFCEHVPQCGG